MKNTVY